MANDEEKLLLRHLKDLAERAFARSIYTYSNFLSLTEQDVFLKAGSEFGFISHELYGGSELAERRIAVFGDEESFGYPPEYPVTVIKTEPVNDRFSEELTHRDYLGALMNLGIERALTGDIIIRDKRAWIYCHESMAEHICDNLNRIKHTEVSCKIVSSDIPELRPVLTEITLNVASQRTDSIVAAFCGLSRNHAESLFRQGKVFINGREEESVSRKIKEGDILTVRGFGKAIYDGISNETKKGRINIRLRKYGM